MSKIDRSTMLTKALISLTHAERSQAIGELVNVLSLERAEAWEAASKIVGDYILPSASREARRITDNIRWDLDCKARVERKLIEERIAESADAETVVVDVQTLAKAAV